MVIVDGPSPEWIGVARRGRLVVDGVERPIRVLLGPPESQPRALDRAVERAGPWLGRVVDGLVPLLGVHAVGDRIGWVYPQSSAISAVHLIRHDGQPVVSARIAADIVARASGVIRAAGELHPGPELYDLWLDERGHVSLSGFTGPYPQSPELRAPVASTGEPGQVYRLGILLARLLTGTAPPAGNDPAHHEAVLRRLSIRAMSAPGADLPERLREYLQGMLAWDPDRRPPLSAIQAALLEAAGESGDALPTWATAGVPGLLETVRYRDAQGPDAADVTLDEPATPVDEVPFARNDPPSAEAEVDGTIPNDRYSWAARSIDDDDHTAESAQSQVPSDTAVKMLQRERRIIPVDVGPPASLASRSRPRLPAAFVRGGDTEGGPIRVSGRTIVLMVLGCVFLLGCYMLILLVAAG